MSSILKEIAQKDKTYMNLFGSLCQNLDQVSLNQKSEDTSKLITDMQAQADEFQRRYTNVKQRNQSSDKVISEMKKQMGCYKEEIENMQKMEAHLTVENYQKLVNDFNQLYDHYKMHKHMSKKLKIELS